MARVVVSYTVCRPASSIDAQDGSSNTAHTHLSSITACYSLFLFASYVECMHVRMCVSEVNVCVCECVVVYACWNGYRPGEAGSPRLGTGAARTRV